MLIHQVRAQPGVRPFTPVQVPLPLENDGLSAAEQRKTFREIALDDRLTVPDGFRSQPSGGLG